MHKNLIEFIAAAAAVCALNTACSHNPTYTDTLNSVPVTPDTINPQYKAQLPPADAKNLAVQLGLVPTDSKATAAVEITQARHYYDMKASNGCDSTELYIEASPGYGNSVLLIEKDCKKKTMDFTLIYTFPDGPLKQVQTPTAANRPASRTPEAARTHVKSVANLALTLAPPLRSESAPHGGPR